MSTSEIEASTTDANSNESWDPIWEEVHQSQHWGKYPPEELIRFVARTFRDVPDRKKIKILDLGCGAGANCWFCAREGFDIHGIEGSKTGVANAQSRLEEAGLSGNIIVGDFCKIESIYPASSFDAIIDIASLTSNRFDSVKSVLQQAHGLLKPGGKIFSMLIAAGSLGDGLGDEIEPGTFTNITDGPVAGKGIAHFFTKEELQELFAPYKDVSVEYSIRSLNNGESEFKHWVVQGTKV